VQHEWKDKAISHETLGGPRVLVEVPPRGGRTPYVRTYTYVYVRADDQSRERSERARNGGTRLRSPKSLLD